MIKLTIMAPSVPVIFSLFLVSSLFYFADSNIQPQVTISKTITVDKSGNGGQFKTIQEAINSVPNNNNKWVRINIKPGTYIEKVIVPKEKPFVMVVGESKENTIIQFNDHAASFIAASFQIFAENFIAKGITFKNTYDKAIVDKDGVKRGGWTPAVFVQSDKVQFHNCGFFSIQDTLADNLGRHYYQNCTISGAIGFIQGAAKSFFKSCVIVPDTRILDGGKRAGWITNQYMHGDNGFVFSSCRIEGSGSTYLGRAMTKDSRVLYYKTYMSSVVVPEGWARLPYFNGTQESFSFAEVESEGPGSDTSKRVKWLKPLPLPELKKMIDVKTFLNEDGWMEKQPNPGF